jgi:glucose-6-phosphate 1-dehydrogenase
MDQSDQLDELLTCRLDFGRKVVEPCTIVIFGASGDLTARKLIPALYHLFAEKQLPNPVRIVGFARREKSHEEWRAELRAGLEQFSRTKRVDAAVWDAFATNLYYCQGEFSEEVAYHKLGDMLSGFGHDQLRHNLVFYLSTSPSQFAEIVEHLSKAKLLRKDEVGGGWQRVVVEKPFGHDLASAQKLNGDLTRFAHEKQIYRIDHYLGKETVQNILMFRFSNAIFEQLVESPVGGPHSDHGEREDRRGRTRAVTTRKQARCATWCRIICCRCWR